VSVDIYLRGWLDVPAEAPVQEAEAVVYAASSGYEVTDVFSGLEVWERPRRGDQSLVPRSPTSAVGGAPARSAVAQEVRLPCSAFARSCRAAAGSSPWWLSAWLTMSWKIVLNRG
jgi:hypothetical protein